MERLPRDMETIREDATEANPGKTKFDSPVRRGPELPQVIFVITTISELLTALSKVIFGQFPLIFALGRDFVSLVPLFLLFSAVFRGFWSKCTPMPAKEGRFSDLFTTARAGLMPGFIFPKVGSGVLKVFRRGWAWRRIPRTRPGLFGGLPFVWVWDPIFRIRKKSLSIVRIVRVPEGFLGSSKMSGRHFLDVSSAFPVSTIDLAVSRVSRSFRRTKRFLRRFRPFFESSPASPFFLAGFRSSTNASHRRDSSALRPG
jgi:hypothetical protein